MSEKRTDPDVILHESGWAVTRRRSNRILKIFLHNSYSTIRKEVCLLELSHGKKAVLAFDCEENHWVCTSDYVDLFSIVDGIPLDGLIMQLRDVFGIWEHDIRYRDLITDEWSGAVVPWYCGLLHQYLPDAKEEISWLQHSHAQHFVHGDFTVSNVFLDSCGQIIVLDFENATLGPSLWDETTLVYSLIENKQYTMARRIYNAFSCEKEMLRTISSVRLAQSIRKSQNIDRRIIARKYIEQYY